MLFPWYTKYPYQNDEVLNLDWTLYQVKKNEDDIKNFININTIKYADPINWDITKQYEANTVVIDALSGDAYISNKPVPSGVAINNTDYWNVIFNYESSIDDLKEQISSVNEGSRTTASNDREAGDVIWLNGKLIVLTRDILAGTQYVEDTSAVGISGNFIYTNVIEQSIASYDSDTKRLTLHGHVDGNSSIITRGDYHVYDGANQAIKILEV